VGDGEGGSLQDFREVGAGWAGVGGTGVVDVDKEGGVYGEVGLGEGGHAEEWKKRSTREGGVNLREKRRRKS